MPGTLKETIENPSKWRLRMAEKIAEKIDLIRFGVEAIYLIGSTKRYNAGPASDIDLLIHFRGNEKQKAELLLWLEGWGLCLAAINEQIIGHKTENLLDIHLITDEDRQNRTSFAVMIGSHYDRAKLLKSR
jgi:predicted nucleotidyltransferase